MSGAVESVPTDAAGMVVAGMLAVLPEGAPLSFRVTAARFVGTGKQRRAVADVEMFDGLPARVAVWRHSLGGFGGWAHEWLSLPGGDVSLEDGRWTRVDDATTPNTERAA